MTWTQEPPEKCPYKYVIQIGPRSQRPQLRNDRLDIKCDTWHLTASTNRSPVGAPSPSKSGPIVQIVTSVKKYLKSSKCIHHSPLSESAYPSRAFSVCSSSSHCGALKRERELKPFSEHFAYTESSPFIQLGRHYKNGSMDEPGYGSY